MIRKDYKGYKVPHSTGVLRLILHFNLLSLKPVKLPIHQILTKRKLLGLIFKNFDPLGLIMPVLIKVKLLFKAAWRSIVNWNDPLTVCFLEQ